MELCSPHLITFEHLGYGIGSIRIVRTACNYGGRLTAVAHIHEATPASRSMNVSISGNMCPEANQ